MKQELGVLLLFTFWFIFQNTNSISSGGIKRRVSNLVNSHSMSKAIKVLSDI